LYDVEGRLGELTGLLRKSGYRLTPQRIAVVRALVEDPSHPSAEAVYARIGGALPTTSLATVYNTLDALKELGQVMEVRPAQGPTRFDVRQPYSHPHLLCTRCGRVEDAAVSGEPLPAATAEAEGWQGLDARLEFRGVCPSCKGGGAGGQP
jgi:Fur family peroxide stress response transcriptional regulator